MFKKRRSNLVQPILIIILMFLTANCAQAEETPTERAPVEDAAPTQEEEPQAPPPSATPEPTPEPTETPSLPPLPPERQTLEIITEDGRTLEGYYYPAATNPAPIVVLMHWAGGDMEDWREIAPWLQNRQGETSRLWQDVTIGLSQQGVEGPWLDPSWFPPLPEDVSFGVLVFNYGDYGASQAGPIPESWVEDSLSAIKKAGQLEGVDPMQIAAIGASIGADGAADSCYLFNSSGEAGNCLGAFSLSPGDYLTDDFTYAKVVQHLQEGGTPAWCLAANDDTYSSDTCLSAEGDLYETYLFPGDPHGMSLIQPDYPPVMPELDVDTLGLLQDFLELVFGVEIN